MRIPATSVSPTQRGERAHHQRQQREKGNGWQRHAFIPVAFLGDAHVEARVPTAAKHVQEDIVRRPQMIDRRCDRIGDEGHGQVRRPGQCPRGLSQRIAAAATASVAAPGCGPRLGPRPRRSYCSDVFRFAGLPLWFRRLGVDGRHVTAITARSLRLSVYSEVTVGKNDRVS